MTTGASVSSGKFGFDFIEGTVTLFRDV